MNVIMGDAFCKMILFRPICWIKTLWNIIMSGFWDYGLNCLVYIDGHDYEEVSPNVLVCSVCGKVSVSKEVEDENIL